MASFHSSYAVTVRREIGASAQSVWEAWTAAGALNAWFTSNATLDLCVGGAYSNGDGDQGEYIEVSPPHRLAFTWHNPTYWPGSKVLVRIDANGSSAVIVTVTQSEMSDERGIELQREGWTWALESLRKYLETGHGLAYSEWRATGKPGLEE